MVKRNSNIDLLRLVAMAFITVHHFAIWGYFIGNEVHTVQPNTVWLQFLELFGKIGVDLFILITDYFAINPRPTFKKIWQLTNTLWQNIFHCARFCRYYGNTSLHRLFVIRDGRDCDWRNSH
ncbi:acyltransferase family protein [Leuconostoc lactis]|uniref:acyltransferase family protein n=1 Tax=Leuconostoc lactis TaxID=1246 RepID=UPI003B980628